jgi:hypothetical protein
MSDHYVIFVGDESWRVGRVRGDEVCVTPVPLAPEATLDVRAGAVKRRLQEDGFADQPVLLAVESSWCLCATISTEGLGRAGRLQTMGFRLEEHLPLSAEEFIADYIPLSDRESLGICTERARLESLIKAFKAAGIDVRHICPTALAAVAYTLGWNGKVDGVLLCSGGSGVSQAGDGHGVGYDFIELREGKPSQWRWLAADDTAVRDRLVAWASSAAPGGAPRQLARIGCEDRPPTATPEGEGVVSVDLENLSGDQAAALYAARVLEGAATPWVDLRCGPLAAPDRIQAYRGPLLAIAAAAVFLLVCVTGVALWRGGQYARLRQESLQQQAEVFRTVLPDQRVPAAVQARLLSEQRTLAGLCGLTWDAGKSGPLTPTSALVHLQRILSSLPPSLPYRILDLNIQPDMVRVDGEARSHAEAEALAAVVRQTGLYEVDPPKTQALKEGGVSFLFIARPLDGPLAPKGGE